MTLIASYLWFSQILSPKPNASVVGVSGRIKRPSQKLKTIVTANVTHPATSSSRPGGLVASLRQHASIASAEPTAAYILCPVCTCLTHASLQGPVKPGGAYRLILLLLLSCSENNDQPSLYFVAYSFFKGSNLKASANSTALYLCFNCWPPPLHVLPPLLVTSPLLYQIRFLLFSCHKNLHCNR